MNRQTFVLDACAVIAAQQLEAGSDQLFGLLCQPETQAVIHAINVCEIHYDQLRRNPRASLEALMDEFGCWEVAVEHEMSLPLVRRASEIKAQWRRVSLADCIALALAEQRGGVLLTTDHHELDPLLAAAYPIRFLR